MNPSPSSQWHSLIGLTFQFCTGTCFDPVPASLCSLPKVMHYPMTWGKPKRAAYQELGSFLFRKTLLRHPEDLKPRHMMSPNGMISQSRACGSSADMGEDRSTPTFNILF